MLGQVGSCQDYNVRTKPCQRVRFGSTNWGLGAGSKAGFQNQPGLVFLEESIDDACGFREEDGTEELGHKYIVVWMYEVANKAAEQVSRLVAGNGGTRRRYVN